MIDIHSHLLYGVDDGSKSIEESIITLSNLYKIGIESVILTPHYIEDSAYNSEVKENKKRIKILENELKKNNIDINLYLGNEIYISDNILELLKEKKITSLNNSKYLLIELPMSGEYNNYIEIFKELILKGYVVVLAHPERYISFQKDFSLILELNKIGVKFQCNIESILQKYGKGSYKTIKKIAKNKMITFLATDIHNNKKDYSYIDVAIKKFKKYYNDEEIRQITLLNQKDILI